MDKSYQLDCIRYKNRNVLAKGDSDVAKIQE